MSITKGSFRKFVGAAMVAVVMCAGALVGGCSDDSSPAKNSDDNIDNIDNGDNGDNGGGDGGGEGGEGGGGDDNGVVIHEVIHDFAVDFAETNIDGVMNGRVSLMRTTAQTISDEERGKIVEYMQNVQVLTEIQLIISRFIEAGIAEYDGSGIGFYFKDDDYEAYDYLEFSVDGNNIDGRIFVKTFFDESGYGEIEINRVYVFSAVYDNGVVKEFEMQVAQWTFSDGQPYPGSEDAFSSYAYVSQDANGNFTVAMTGDVEVYDDDGNFLWYGFVSNGLDYSHILPLRSEFVNLETKCTIDALSPEVFPVVMEIMETVDEMFAEYWEWEDSLFLDKRLFRSPLSLRLR